MRVGRKQRTKTFKLWKGRWVGHREVNNDRNWGVSLGVLAITK